MAAEEITVEATPKQTGRVFAAAGEACAMLEAILVLGGHDWSKKNRGVALTWTKLCRALKAAGVPEEGMTFSPIARTLRRRRAAKPKSRTNSALSEREPK